MSINLKIKKITIKINLTSAEMKGITLYLIQTSPDVKPHITRKDVEYYLQSCAIMELHNPKCAVGDYVKMFEDSEIDHFEAIDHNGRR